MHQTLASLLASPSASVLKGMVARKEEFPSSALLFVGPMLRPAIALTTVYAHQERRAQEM